MILDSIRARLTAWYALVFALALAFTGIAVYFFVEQLLRRAVDDSLRTNARQMVQALNDEADESNSVLTHEAALEVVTNFHDRSRTLAILRTDGSTFAASPGRSLIEAGALSADIARQNFGVRSAKKVRLLLTPVDVRRERYIMAIEQSLEPQEELLEDLRDAMLLTLPIALLIASAGGYVLARKSLAPVAAMASSARAIGADNLGHRIAVANPRDELGQLALTLNDLLGRLEESFASQRRFMADASHELRSPVSILQGEIDVTLSRENRDAAEYRDSLEIMRRSVRRLTRIVRDLFLLARSDAGQYPLRDERFYLDEVVAGTVKAFRTVAADRHVSLREEHSCEVAVRGDEDLVQQLVANLIDNALKFSPAGGEVVVRCSRAGSEARVEVEDHGGGIPPGIGERVFERFFRADPSRSTPRAMHRDAGSGAGLGLPIARWVAEVHRGRVWIEKSDESGTVFVAALPFESVEPGSLDV